MNKVLVAFLCLCLLCANFQQIQAKEEKSTHPETTLKAQDPVNDQLAIDEEDDDEDDWDEDE